MTQGLQNAVYLNCPRCGLTIAPKAEWLSVEHCPRCIARHRTLVKLFTSPLPAAELYAPEVRPPYDGLQAPRARAGDRTLKPLSRR